MKGAREKVLTEISRSCLIAVHARQVLRTLQKPPLQIGVLVGLISFARWAAQRQHLDLGRWLVSRPYLHFYAGDWLKDPALVLLSLASRGFWFEAVLNIHEHQNGGKLVATLQQIARMTRCSEAEAAVALSEVAKYNVGDVYESNGVYTIICRRMQREWELSEKRRKSGSKGGSKKASKTQANPDYDYDSDSGIGSGLSQVIDFARTEGISVADGEWFFWKCHANGWTNNGRAIRDWKATLRSWQKAGYLPSQRNSEQLQLSSRSKIADPNQARRDDEFERSQREWADYKQKKGQSAV